MVTLSKIYTRGGDGGETSLGTGARVAKYDPRVSAYGTVDEANGTIGLARLELSRELATDDDADRSARLADADAMLARVQNDLFDLGADLCTPHDPAPKHQALRIVDDQVVRLEQEIDRMNAELTPLQSFILPGGRPTSAWLHLGRTVVRRAEREIVALSDRETVNEAAIRYANRLSDHLFVMARWLNDKGAADVLWVPGANR